LEQFISESSDGYLSLHCSCTLPEYKGLMSFRMNQHMIFLGKENPTLCRYFPMELNEEKKTRLGQMVGTG